MSGGRGTHRTRRYLRPRARVRRQPWPASAAGTRHPRVSIKRAEQARAPRAQWRESSRGTMGHGTRPTHEAHVHQVRTARTRGASGALPATAGSLAAALDIKGMRSGGWGKRWERE